MSRRRRRNRSEQRDDNTIASFPAVRSFSARDLVSDRRLFHPEQPFAPVFSPRRDQRRVVEKVSHDAVRQGRAKSRKGYAGVLRSVFKFAVPKKVDLCVRRKQRREVMFALRRTGKGSRKLRRRRNFWTGVNCK